MLTLYHKTLKLLDTAVQMGVSDLKAWDERDLWNHGEKGQTSKLLGLKLAPGISNSRFYPGNKGKTWLTGFVGSWFWVSHRNASDSSLSFVRVTGGISLTLSLSLSLSFDRVRDRGCPLPLSLSLSLSLSRSLSVSLYVCLSVCLYLSLSLSLLPCRQEGQGITFPAQARPGLFGLTFLSLSLSISLCLSVSLSLSLFLSQGLRGE